MTRWSLEQIASAIYSQLFLISLVGKRIATALEARELRSESSHPSDAGRAATIVVDCQSDEKETPTSETLCHNEKTDTRQQQLFPDASDVRPKRGRSDAGRRQPVNFEGREPTEAMICDGSTDQGFGNPVSDVSSE